MQNLIKLAVWAAPAFVLALILILGRLDKQEAKFDVDAARFDRQFANQQLDFAKKNEFWQQEKKEADKRLAIARGKQDQASGKVAQQLDFLEKNLKKMDEKKEEK